MRFAVFFSLLFGSLLGAPPAELVTALEKYRADPPPGWSFTQTTTAEGKTVVERCDAAKPSFDRWALIEKNGAPPTPSDLKEYSDMRSRRSRGGTAPDLAKQLDLETCETVAETEEHTTYRCRVKPGESNDAIARFLRATVVLHRPTRSIESLELSNTGPFSPTVGVKIAEMKTEMTYSAARDDQPPLPTKVTTRLRGRAFWWKSLDADMVVTFSDYQNVRNK